MDNTIKFNRNHLLILVIYLIALVLMFNLGRVLTTNQFHSGSRVKEDIYSIKDFNNTIREEQLRQEAADRVEAVYKKIPQVPVTTRENISSFFDDLSKLKLNTLLTPEDKLKRIQEEQEFDVEGAQAALNMTYQESNYLEIIVTDLVSQWLAEGIKDADPEVIKTKAEEALNQFDITDDQKLVGREILQNYTIPNEIIDTQATNALREEAMEQIAPIEVKRGDLLFEKGYTLTQSDVEVLVLAGIAEQSQGMGRVKFAALSIGMIMLSLAWYIVLKTLSMIGKDPKSLLLLLLMDWIMLMLPFILVKELMWLWPIIALCLLARTLIDERIALFNLAYVIIMIMFLYAIDMKYLVVMSLMGWVSIWLSKNLASYGRSRLMVVSLFASLSGIALLFFIELSKGAVGLFLWKPLLYILINGIISAIVYVGSLPLWEHIFGRLTTERLLELSNPQRPLLRELIEKAPGTYQHSLIVANLSEACALAIGADDLLCRVGAYYHDIGKTKNPYYFKENQQETSVHDILSFEDSARVIKEHVTIGKRMAREYQLPKEIISFISEHHGDSLVRYFYNSAVNAGENPDPNDYRYPGPKPQSKETGIMMIADSVEAASRTLEEKNEENFAALIDSIVRDKYAERQFDECPLTLEELAIIKATLVQSLLGMYHERIVYPKENKNGENTHRLSG